MVESVGDLKLTRINILDLPPDTVAESVERRHDKAMTWVRFLASVRFLFVPILSFFYVALSKEQFRQQLE